ncbi:hypothetical protein KFK09_012078 [Dendrobium nobile]|uniref:Uncharacterized protein n=1 Tax=Dendrobium nobile TaxID=94219 RepID=A0A8T3BJU5_DENNO|nr:hypothetical protein KFK09_012078 [Dendrobium nobile]
MPATSEIHDIDLLFVALEPMSSTSTNMTNVPRMMANGDHIDVQVHAFVKLRTTRSIHCRVMLPSKLMINKLGYTTWPSTISSMNSQTIAMATSLSSAKAIPFPKHVLFTFATPFSSNDTGGSSGYGLFKLMTEADALPFPPAISTVN